MDLFPTGMDKIPISGIDSQHVRIDSQQVQIDSQLVQIESQHVRTNFQGICKG